MSVGAHAERVLHVLATRLPIGRLAGWAALAAFALVLASVAISPVEARVVAPVKQPTILELDVPATVELASHPVARVRLTSGGTPVAGQLISIRIGTRVSQQVTTGLDGTATTEIARDFSSGKYQVVATFAGTTSYQSATSPTRTFTVKTVELTISTVPSMPDTPLIRVGGGKVLRTGPDGVVHVAMTQVGSVDLTLALPADGSTIGLRLARWDDGSTDAGRTIRIPDTLHLTVGLYVLYPLQFEFSTPDGASIAAADVPLVKISDSAGAEQSLTGPGPYWLRSNAITRLATGLESGPVEYRVLSIPLDGSDVVNRGQQRFVADRAKSVPLQLLVFYLSIHGKDALLKTPAGSSVTITSSTGPAQVLKLDRDSQTTVRLSRGEYRIVLGGGIGFSLSTPVALSRDQPVDVLLVSLLDITLALGVGLVLAVGLIVIGRPHVLKRRKDSPPSDPGEAEPPGPAWPTSPREAPRPRSDS